MLEVNHIYNLDCLQGLKLLDDKSVDLTLTSPPFKEKDVVSDMEYQQFYTCFMSEAVRITKNVICIIQSATRLTDVVQRYPPDRTLIWYKGVMAPAYRYNPIFCYQMRPDYKINKYIWSDVIGCFAIKTANKIHKDQDPVYVYETILKMFKDCQLILDPFAGSCTTAEACRNLSRDYICFEINPKHCDMAERRLKKEVHDS